MLFNYPRAQEVMEREGLDGLIALRPINQYYLSDYWGLFNTPVGYDAAYLAVVPRNDAEPAALIVPALEIRRTVSVGHTWMPNLYAYSSPDGDELLADGTPKGVNYSGWPVEANGELLPTEKKWVDITEQHGSNMSPDAFWALSRAVRNAGLSAGTVATDDPRIGEWLSGRGIDVLDCRYQPELFNEIRLVKTEDELAIMRRAATINEHALLSAVDAMADGVHWDALENIYMAEMARQGGRGVYLMCGVGELPAGHARTGEAIMFDGLGQYQHYHGDFGRCAVIGNAGARQRERHRAICAGWDKAMELLRPGVLYSELSAAVGEVVRREGIADFRNPIVHSLGLEHTDDPKPAGVQPQSKPDQRLRENMVVNVDMPHTEIGWGSIHTEDTVRITADGCEALTSLDLSLRVVPE